MSAIGSHVAASRLSYELNNAETDTSTTNSTPLELTLVKIMNGEGMVEGLRVRIPGDASRDRCRVCNGRPRRPGQQFANMKHFDDKA